MGLSEDFIAQLDQVRGDYQSLRELAGDDVLTVLPEADITRFITRARAVVERVAGTASAYNQQCMDILSEPINIGRRADRLYGVLDCLQADLAADYLKSVIGLARGDLFGDYLDMAEHLHSEGYKDAAAVIAGGSLEAHLRGLAQMSGVQICDEKTGKPRKAESINADLARAKVYSTTDNKHVTGWLAIRNHAAHGEYDRLTAEQVRLLVASVRDFISRYPA